MTIVKSDIKFYESLNPNSGGGSISTNEIPDLTLENLFASVTVDHAKSGYVDYCKLFVKNTNSLDNWLNIVSWILAQTPSDFDSIDLGIGTMVDDDGSKTLQSMTATSVVAIQANSSDTRPVILVGEDNNGVRVTETLVANNTSEVVGSQLFSKLYNSSVNSILGSSDITIKQGSGGGALGTIQRGAYSAILYLPAVSKQHGFKLGTLAAGASHGLWIRRTVLADAEAYAGDQATIICEGETG